MSRRVQTPDGVVHEFPDDATDAEISEALGSVPAKQANRATTRTWTDTTVDAIPMVAAGIGGALGAASGIPTLGLTSLPAAAVGAGALGAGGEALRQLINRARGVESPPTPGAAAGDIALTGAEQGALEGVGGAVTKGLSAGGRAVYRGYLKPSLSRVNIGKASEIVNTAIEEGLAVTHGGVQTAQKLIGELKGKVDALLQQATGRTVNLSEVANDVRAWAQRTYDRPGRDPRDYKAALAVADRIDRHPSIEGFMPGEDKLADLPAANQIKRDLQGAARDKFGVPGGTAETNAEKVASAGMRRAVEAGEPAVGPLNARESRLIDAARSINQAVNREANQSKLHGVKTIGAAMVGAEDYRRTGDAKGAAARALALRAGLEPAVATRAAILAARLGDLMPSAAVADLARVAVTVASEAQQEPDSEVQRPQQ